MEDLIPGQRVTVRIGQEALISALVVRINNRNRAVCLFRTDWERVRVVGPNSILQIEQDAPEGFSGEAYCGFLRIRCG